MFDHSPASKPAIRVVYAVAASALVALSLWVVSATTGGPTPSPPPAATTQAQANPTSTSTGQQIPSRDQILAVAGPHFGISAAQVPWSASTVDKLSVLAGRRPTMMEYFVNWTAAYDVAPVVAAYQQGAVPILSWQPWAGLNKGQNQPAYALRTIINGSHDTYITAFATAVRDAKWPVVIRFAHEMNGFWYPWSERRSGNRRGEYVKAWRHVHDIFQRVGALNVIWIWSPNIIRPLPNVDLASLYPGPGYVDWVGFVGYGGPEATAGQTFDSTIKAIRKFSTLPLLITETGARAGPGKSQWTVSFFSWLAKRTDVVGFIWFQRSPAEGATGDWRFNSDARTLAAFKAGLASAPLADPIAISK